MNEIQFKKKIRKDGNPIDINGMRGHILQEGRDIMIILRYDSEATAKIGKEEILSFLETRKEAVE